jgi:hypothetical protein
VASRKKELARFTAEIMDSAVATIGGIRFTEKAVLSAYAQITSDGCTVEDLAMPERTKKGVRPDEPWKGHAMARSVGASIDGTVLKVEFSVPDTRYGKILMATADTAGGFDRIRFMPVGQGIPDKEGVVDQFRLSYVTFKSDLNLH